MENILLRFRDTEDLNTIAEHQNIIDKYGYTWWGWWKKESEPDRNKLLAELKNDISNSQFFLFDRSTERFFLLKVTELYFEGNEKTLSPEKEKTPEYYNKESLNLWLKLSFFEKISLENFLEKFKTIPTLDYTFFTKTDIEQNIKESSSKNKRIKLESDYILHLSDIHFGEDFGFPAASYPGSRSLLDTIWDFVNYELRSKIGLLIVSGDITSRGDANYLLTHGLDFLNKLCDLLKISREAVVIIPGNHDIPLQNSNFQNYNHETTFRLFLDNFYGIKKEPFGLDFFEFPCGVKVDILRIHSVKLRKKEESNYGYVEWPLYKNLLAGHSLDGDIKIAVIHHHLVSTPIEEILDPSYPYASISVTIDSGRVIEGLQEHEFDFVLNGHQHIPGITKVNRGVKNDFNVVNMDQRKELTILSAGSAGAKNDRLSNEMRYNSFSLYLVNKDSLKVEVKYYNPSVAPRRHYISDLEF